MRPALDYSKDLPRMLTDGKTMDEALTELRTVGASIIDCIVRTSRGCEIAEAKQIVETSPPWSDLPSINDEILRDWSESDFNPLNPSSPDRHR